MKKSIEELRKANLSTWHGAAQGKLDKLLPKLEAAFCDEGA